MSTLHFIYILVIIFSMNVNGAYCQTIPQKYSYAKQFYYSYNDQAYVPTQTGKKVKNGVELKNALKTAKKGDVIIFSKTAKINLTALAPLTIPSGVTLYSNRKATRNNGVTLYTTALGTNPMLKTGGPGVKIIGVRLKGPDTATRYNQMKKLLKENNYYSIPNSTGIYTEYDDLLVENCEILGWTYGGVCVKKAKNAIVRYNYIHHNQREGLGYGVVLEAATARITNNIFSYNRHSVAADGRPGTAYVAAYNIILKGSPENSHIFDVHGGRDRKEKNDIAGDSITIRDNINYTNNPIYWERGKPRFYLKIDNNLTIKAN